VYRVRYVCGVIIAISMLFVVSGLLAQEDIINKRKDLMDAAYDAHKAIKNAVKAREYATIAEKAREIMGYMDKVNENFPKGSIVGKTRAKPEIWEKWEHFSKLSVMAKEVAGALAKAASAKDEAAVQARFKDLGPESPFLSGICFECHKDYRVTPPRKR
jgi:cytochrome c556